MTLTPEQTKAVAAWAAAGDNLAEIQRKLSSEFKVSITYMDLRFLLSDLDLKLRDATPRADASIAEAPKGPPTSAAAKPEGAEPGAEDEFGEEELAPSDQPPPAGKGSATVNVDKVTVIPGALASGTMAFSDGVTGKWVVDNYGRPGITEVSKPGYRPTAADAQAFMEELSRALQKRGF